MKIYVFFTSEYNGAISKSPLNIKHTRKGASSEHWGLGMAFGGGRQSGALFLAIGEGLIVGF